MSLPSKIPAIPSSLSRYLLSERRYAFGQATPRQRTVSPDNTTSSCDSEVSVTTVLVACLAKPFPFVRSSRLRFGCRLVHCSSSSSLGVGVVPGADGGAVGGDGERRREGGVEERREAVFSSSCHN